ncbi:MAG: DUF3160 domain-containing protein [Candidatus Methanogasteraceae archaeon]
MRSRILVLIILSIVISGCVDQKATQSEPSHVEQPELPPPKPTDEPTDQAKLETEPIDLSGAATGTLDFTRYYSLQPLSIDLKVPGYDLPLQTDQISNYDSFSEEITLSNSAKGLLGENGFVVIENPLYRGEEDIIQPYKMLADDEIPIFVTTDSLLHLYHIQFDETLRQIEEREFYDLIWEISEELLNDSMESYENSDGELKEASKRNAAYFAVGLSLLKPSPEQVCQSENKWECTDAYFEKEDIEHYSFEVPSFVADDVEDELELIEGHSGFVESPIFIYSEDYSQYVPRGHYTRSEKLKNYFKAFMWYGRMSMLLKGSDTIPPGTTDPYSEEGLIATEDARIQTMAACMISSEFSGNQDLMDKWDRIYSVTAFYVGLSDDLGPYEYMDALNHVFGETFDSDDLNEDTIGAVKAKLAEHRSPEIYGGTGACEILPPFTPEQADQCLLNTKGFRMMGQRFIPDSYMFTNLVGTYTDLYSGDQEPFTLIIDGAGRPVRGFPRGLDVMALLGSDRSRELLDELDDSNYKEYDRQYGALEDEFDSFDAAEWNRKLYWSWLFALKPLLDDHGAGYPTFMQTSAWQDKELTTALASWTELRHDTILYAKQSYTAMTTSMPPEKKPVVGYVEPVPEFYNRLLALTRMTNSGLGEMGVLDESAKRRLENLDVILERLVEISSKELENEELTEDDYDFIKNFGDNLDGVIAGVEDKAKKTTIVADVHTDGNTQQVLEEGVGYVDLIVVAYKLPDGRILVGAGPVMSYYEFKHPMSERLTDEAWRDLLAASPPEKPEWVSNFAE